MLLHEGMILANRYKVIRALGTGGMSAAHLTEDQRLHIHCVIKDELRSPQEINPQIPDLVADAIMCALRIHPRERFQLVAEMLNALQAQEIDEG